MRVLIVAVGSRGDVAPLTGLGTALRVAGHSVTIAGYEMSAGLVTGSGLGFRALPGDPRLLDAASWRRGGPGRWEPSGWCGSSPVTCESSIRVSSRRHARTPTS